MGYYTELSLDVKLSKDAPIELLEKLSSGEMEEELWINKTGKIPSLYSVSELPELPINHIFGKSHRWSQIFSENTTEFDSKERTLVINCDIKAYNEIYDHLIDWLKPFIISGEIMTKGEDQGSWFVELTK